LLFGLRFCLPGFCSFRAFACENRRDYDGAERWLLRALRLEKAMQRIAGQRGVAVVSASLGFVYHHQRRVEEAAAMFQRAIDIYARIGRVDDAAPVYAGPGQ